MTQLSVSQPRSLAALKRLMSGGGQMHFVAGGTDLLVAGRALPREGTLVDLSHLGDLASVKADGVDIRIGGATRIATLAADPLMAGRLPALAQAAAQCGSAQIRNRATIGGNIAQAAPAADLVPVLWAARARLVLWHPDGPASEIAIEDYFPAPGVLIAYVLLPGTPCIRHSAFAKLGPRRDLTIARLNMALLTRLHARRFGEVRIVAGALGRQPVHMSRAAAALTNRNLTPETLTGFARALSQDVDATIPDRASRQWKRYAIVGLGLDLIAGLFGLSPRDPLFAEVA